MTDRNQRIGMTMRLANHFLVRPTAAIGAAVLLAGCQTLAAPQQPPGGGSVRTAAASSTDQENAVTLVSDESILETAKKNSTRVMNFVSGREQENPTRGKELYQQADQLFRQAAAMPKGEGSSTYSKAARLFQRAGEAAPETALQQDAMFMQAESLFFANRLTESADIYEKLQKEFPRNRHVDRAAARMFAIGRYWIETVKADRSWFPLNLTDSKRPRLDVDGHAIRVLDQIRYDDPTGRLADDATMAAAAEYIRQQKFEEADEFLTDLRETYSDSEHLFLAHMLGIRCKLATYAGPAYSGLVLEEAEKLVQQTRQRFPDKLSEPKYRDEVAKAAAEIAFKRAERLAYRADYREKRKEYGAARLYYRLILQHHSDTPQAKIARERLQATEKYPAVPTPRLAWLMSVFPDSGRSNKPLKTVTPKDDQPSTETMLR